MAAILAQILRQIIMAVATGAIVTGGQELLDGTAKEAVKSVRDEEGLTEEEAKGIVGNILIDLATNSALIFATLKTGAGVKAAEWLGLTSRGFAKKTLSTKAAQVAAKPASAVAVATAKSWVPKILKIVAIPGSIVWLTNAIANIIEPGIYKPEQTNAIYKKLGIPFQYPASTTQLQPGPFDNQQFKDYANALEAAGIQGIKNEDKKYFNLYSRQLLADLINLLYGQEILKGNAPSAKQMIPLIAPYLIGAKGTISLPSDTKSTSSAVATGNTGVKVFTGILSSGKLGDGLEFEARPDDLIENIGELQQAINNNAAPFVASLLGRLIYEVKIVSSVLVGGMRKYGTSQTIQVGQNKNGSAKMKTIVNKFAVMDIYLAKEDGGRTKLKTIVLGPTNALNFQPTTTDLTGLSARISKDLITSNTDEISVVATNTPTSIVAPSAGGTGTSGEVQAEQQQEPAPAGYIRIPQGTQVFDVQTGAYLFTAGAGAMVQEAQTISDGRGGFTTKGYSFKYPPGYIPPIASRVEGGVVSTPQVAQSSQGASIPSSTEAPRESTQVQSGPIGTQQPTITIGATKTLPQAALSASSLYEFYTAQGLSLPSLSTRAALYQSLGLGQATFYAGTAEQNTKLLQKLKYG